MTFTAAKKEEIRLRYLEVDTSNVADVLDNMNLLQQGLSSQFGPYPDTTKRMAGWAYTIRGQMTPYPQGGDADKMTACQGISSGEISVWSGDGNGICAAERPGRSRERVQAGAGSQRPVVLQIAAESDGGGSRFAPRAPVVDGHAARVGLVLAFTL